MALVGSHHLVASSVATLFVDERACDTQGVVLPRAEVQIVVRFGPSTPSGLDIHALGSRLHLYRKVLRSGLRVVGARLRMGTTEAVLGVPASALSGQIIALEELWGAACARRLCDRLAAALDTAEAAAILEAAIAERLALTNGQATGTRLVLAAAERLTSANVNAVADELGVSERHLRRVFRETTGVSPKTFAKLERFRHAVRAAGAETHVSWASIATRAGYYDQAHLISEFRALAGVTPQALLGELRVAQAIG
jgi:AraC-like DNA-binding protein